MPFFVVPIKHEIRVLMHTTLRISNVKPNLKYNLMGPKLAHMYLIAPICLE
jgi:hypothetical protein